MEDKIGKYKMIVSCSFCDSKFEIYKRDYKRTKTKNFYCNNYCKSEWQKDRSPSQETILKMRSATSGENNGRYVNGYTYKDSICSCGQKKDWRAKHCMECHPHTSFLNRTHTTETKLLIGNASKDRFTEKYQKNFRTKMELLGKWLPISQMSDYRVYYHLCEWQQRMFDIVVLGVELLQEFGVLNSRTNPLGVVRDHRLSRMDGLVLGVYPAILRHPCNCEVIQHKENVKKGSSSSIDINTLVVEIRAYQKYWFEQDKCLALISKYEKGTKFNISEYKEG